ncbi:MAG: GNAT family N-acetyltransferase [Saprospiraceae bacterium]|nr:GNAT family N-acetyltransferase [Saprospiraceae bacterium]MCC6841961.1 GNAT family N-acetyltransferase [Saprospiraceae bacterium]
MHKSILSVREITAHDIPHIADYWLQTDPEYFCSMGCDLTKFPSRSEWIDMLNEQLKTEYEHKKSYCIIWLLNDVAIGHCNVNQITYAEKANMHLHLWNQEYRKSGFGRIFVKLSLPYFFKNLKLTNLICEPYSLNPAPNKTLAKLGFEFIKTYRCIPGSLNFEQEVNQWQLSYEKFQKLFNSGEMKFDNVHKDL